MISKFHNKKIDSPDGKFDSKYEYTVWCDLKQLEKFGVIKNLQRQVKYELIPTIKTTAETLKTISYYADFVYYEKGVTYIMDTKGFETDVYSIKKRLLINQYVDDTHWFIERKKNKKDKVYKKVIDNNIFA